MLILAKIVELEARESKIAFKPEELAALVHLVSSLPPLEGDLRKATEWCRSSETRRRLANSAGDLIRTDGPVQMAEVEALRLIAEIMRPNAQEAAAQLG